MKNEVFDYKGVIRNQSEKIHKNSHFKIFSKYYSNYLGKKEMKTRIIAGGFV